MAALADPVPTVPSRVMKLESYSGLHKVRARVYTPGNVDQLKQLFAYANATPGTRITIRGGGHSFDSQSLNTDLVVSMRAFDSIEVDSRACLLTVGPGATWGAILDELEPRGMLPAVTVTTSHASAGGTLAGDCLSRFSPAYGKEGTDVVSFELLTPLGDRLVCTPPQKGKSPAAMTPGERAFVGVIGGLGYLGAVTSITYKVLAVGQRHGPLGVSTRVQKFKTFEGLATALVPRTLRMVAEASDPDDPTKDDAIYSVLYAGPDGRQMALLFRSTITTRRERRRLVFHRPRQLRRMALEMLARRPLLCRIGWRWMFRRLRTDRSYIDDLPDYTFLMDGNVRAKRAGRRIGFRMNTIQQTFVVPVDRRREPGGRSPEEDLNAWLEYTHRILRERDLSPTMLDVMYLPADERFLMSATAELAGFAVSYAFETSNRRRLERIVETFAEFSDALWETYEGRVYLVKNVHADPRTLAAMYGRNATDFFALKRQLDPNSVLRNEFVDDNFGDLLAPAAPAAEPAPV